MSNVTDVEKCHNETDWAEVYDFGLARSPPGHFTSRPALRAGAWRRPSRAHLALSQTPPITCSMTSREVNRFSHLASLTHVTHGQRHLSASLRGFEMAERPSRALPVAPPPYPPETLGGSHPGGMGPYPSPHRGTAPVATLKKIALYAGALFRRNCRNCAVASSLVAHLRVGSVQMP